MQTTVAHVLLLSTLFFCCSKQEQRRPDLIAFPLRGEVVAIDTVQHKIMISHEAIPHYMDAMTMQFRVKDLELLKSVQPGDSIEGVVVVSKTESWLETVTVVGKKAND